MSKTEFLNLITKYNNGECSKEEAHLLFKYCEDVQEKNFAVSWDLSEKEIARVRLFKRINQTIQESSTTKARIHNWKRFRPVAAILIGLVITTYFYLANTTDISRIPENAITLKLDNGILKVIEEDGTTKIFDNNGEVVGKQNGNQLVYTKQPNAEDLVYNTLYVPYGKTFELQLSDGTKAHLNAGSSLKYPIQFLNGTDRKIFITGEAFLDVAKDSLHPFIVNTNNLNVKVLGTQFNVTAYPEDVTTDIVLIEGSVKLYTNSPTNEKNSTVLKPGFKGSLNIKENRISKQEVLTSTYTSWRNGKLVFRNMGFQNILKKLERHYNVVIVNNNSKLTDEKFNANFGTQDIYEVLEELNTYYNIEYTILKDGKIIIE